MISRSAISFLLLLSLAVPSLAQPFFRDTKLRLGSTNYFAGIPVSLALVPADPSLLLVGTTGGTIRLIRVARKGLLYSVVKELGEVSVGDRRSVLGINADPFEPNTFFVSTSVPFWRERGFGEDGWQNGRIERLFFKPETLEIQLDEIAAVKGLPASPTTAGVYSAIVDPLTARLLISIPAFNNGGVPTEDGALPDSVLSGAILDVDIRRGGTLRVKWSSSNPKVAVPLDTPEQSGIAIYAEGIRSAFQVAISRFNRPFLVDGGANVGRGERSLSCFRSRPFLKSFPDKVIRVRRGEYYGHPNRQREQCTFISPEIKPEVARSRFPGYTPPLFTNMEAIRKGDVGSGTVGVAFYESNLFPGFRGTLLGSDSVLVFESGREGRKAPGLVAYSLKKQVAVRVGGTAGTCLAVNIFGDVFAAQAPNRTIGVAVPKVGPARRGAKGIWSVFPSRGVPGSYMFVTGVGLAVDGGIEIGGNKCTEAEIVDGKLLLVRCKVPGVESFQRTPLDVSVGEFKLTSAFTILNPLIAQPSVGEIGDDDGNGDEDLSEEGSPEGSPEESAEESAEENLIPSPSDGSVVREFSSEDLEL